MLSKIAEDSCDSMPNLNLRLDDKDYWRFHKIKSHLKCKTNEECLKKLMDSIKLEEENSR